jgi:hypothetical protein
MDIVERLRRIEQGDEVQTDAAGEIERLRAALARDGWKLVPLEPSVEQLATGCYAAEKCGMVDIDWDEPPAFLREIYRAMVGAAPPASEQKEPPT